MVNHVLLKTDLFDRSHFALLFWGVLNRRLLKRFFVLMWAFLFTVSRCFNSWLKSVLKIIILHLFGRVVGIVYLFEFRVVLLCNLTTSHHIVHFLWIFGFYTVAFSFILLWCLFIWLRIAIWRAFYRSGSSSWSLSRFLVFIIFALFMTAHLL
jgi:hypothetical protein